MAGTQATRSSTEIQLNETPNTSPAPGSTIQACTFHREQGPPSLEGYRDHVVCRMDVEGCTALQKAFSPSLLGHRQ